VLTVGVAQAVGDARLEVRGLEALAFEDDGAARVQTLPTTRTSGRREARNR